MMGPVLILVAYLAQTLQVYSEFRRPDPMGAVIAADRGGPVREIISPAVARNAYASLYVYVNVPEGEEYKLFIAQNPDHTFRPELYRATYENGIPDKLEPQTLPVSGTGPALYWLDVWVPAETPARRMRLEAQMHALDRWIIYPMEVRVQPAVVPAFSESSVSLPGPDQRADATVYATWRDTFCRQPTAASPAELTARALVRRNAQQDIALAKLDNQQDYRGLFCGNSPPLENGEWYLELRDRLKK
jgi:hypothetical protein